MNVQKIKKLQKEYGYDSFQTMINNGIAWKMEGSVGRDAMHLLKVGVCMLPKKVHYDYYGNRIPSRDELTDGTKGTYSNCKGFWEGVENDSIYLEKH